MVKIKGFIQQKWGKGTVGEWDWLVPGWDGVRRRKASTCAK